MEFLSSGSRLATAIELSQMRRIGEKTSNRNETVCFKVCVNLMHNYWMGKKK